jgi:catechol 2,3-dioxygenase-like lactoylglutathione lyase family enzyme
MANRRRIKLNKVGLRYRAAVRRRERWRGGSNGQVFSQGVNMRNHIPPRSSSDHAGRPDIPLVSDSRALPARRDILGLLCALALPGSAQTAEPLFEIGALNHINIRASNPTRSAHFYQSLFGGRLQWIEKIPPNPTSPPAESWYLSLGQQFLSISPSFPALHLAPGLDHICPALRNYQPKTAAAKLKERGIAVMSGGGVWVRDPDGVIYQFVNYAGASKPAVAPPMAKPKAGDTPVPAAAPFVPVEIRQVTLRVADLNKTAGFLATVFGGEMAAGSTKQSRSFKFGDSVLRLIVEGTSGTSHSAGMDRFAIAVKDFSPDSARRALQEHGVKPHGRSGEVLFRDPDGIQVQLVSAA